MSMTLPILFKKEPFKTVSLRDKNKNDINYRLLLFVMKNSLAKFDCCLVTNQHNVRPRSYYIPAHGL